MRDVYIILGSPGSGKTNQAILLAEKLNLSHVSWGKISKCRELDIKIQTDNKKRAYLIAGIIEKEINDFQNNQKTKGVILDGFPRRKSEAFLLVKMLEKHNLKLKGLVNINASLCSIKANFKKRLVCSLCGRTYDYTIASHKPDVCDYDKGRLVRERISERKIKSEFNQFLEENEEAYDFLKQHADYFFSVSGDEDEITIFSNIIYKLNNGVRENYQLYRRQSSAILPTKFGVFIINTYLSQIDYSFHVALIKGEVRGKTGVLTRAHSSCMTGDVFGSLKCDCGQQLQRSMRKINKEGCGVVIYLLQEGRGINIINKVNAYSLQAEGLDTIEANEQLGLPGEMRQYRIVKDILTDLGIKSIRLLTNNPDKIHKLTDLGIVIESIEKLECKPKAENEKYLSTKKNRMGHKLSYVK